MSTSTESHQVTRLIDYCRGKEAQPDAIGAVATFIRDNIETNPPADLPRWTRNLDAFKKFARHRRPPLALADIDAAMAASRSAAVAAAFAAAQAAADA